MPSVSEEQRKFMQAACHDKEFAEKAGISQEIACEFVEVDKRRDAKKKKEEKDYGRVAELVYASDLTLI